MPFSQLIPWLIAAACIGGIGLWFQHQFEAEGRSYSIRQWITMCIPFGIAGLILLVPICALDPN